MPRNLTADMITALAAPIIQPAVFVQMQFATHAVPTTTTTLYIWSGVGSTSWNGHTWLGVGNLLDVSTIDEVDTVEAKGITITLSGLDATFLPDVLAEYQLGAPVTVYLGLWSTTVPNTLVDNPIVTWTGNMDQPEIDIGPKEISIAIKCESRLIDMDISVERRYTMQDQTALWPFDEGFQFVNGLQDFTLFWANYPLNSSSI